MMPNVADLPEILVAFKQALHPEDASRKPT